MNWAHVSRSTTLKKEKTNSSLVDSTYNNIAKLNKMPHYLARKDKDMFS